MLLALAGCGARASSSSGPSTTSPSHSASTATCRPPVLAFRGQGQSRRGFDGGGREADQVARRLGSRVVGIRFPSGPGSTTYDQEVAAGVRATTRIIRRSCGRVVLVGYSQGAEVAHRVAVAHPGRIALAVLMGDPVRDPAEHVRTLTLGTGSLSGRGNGGPGARFPVAVRGRVLEVCVRDDDVCNAPLSGRVGPPSVAHHTAYQGIRAVRAIVGAAS